MQLAGKNKVALSDTRRCVPACLARCPSPKLCLHFPLLLIRRSFLPSLFLSHPLESLRSPPSAPYRPNDRPTTGRPTPSLSLSISSPATHPSITLRPLRSHGALKRAKDIRGFGASLIVQSTTCNVGGNWGKGERIWLVVIKHILMAQLNPDLSAPQSFRGVADTFHHREREREGEGEVGRASHSDGTWESSLSLSLSLTYSFFSAALIPSRTHASSLSHSLAQDGRTDGRTRHRRRGGEYGGRTDGGRKTSQLCGGHRGMGTAVQPTTRHNCKLQENSKKLDL